MVDFSLVAVAADVTVGSPIMLLLLVPMLMLPLSSSSRYVRGSPPRGARAINKNSNSSDVVGSCRSRGSGTSSHWPPPDFCPSLSLLARSASPSCPLSTPPLSLPLLLPLHRSLYLSPSSTCYHSRNGHGCKPGARGEERWRRGRKGVT